MVNWKVFDGSAAQWDQQLGQLHGHFYQSFSWAEVKRSLGWKPLRLFLPQGDAWVAAASILVKKIAGVAMCWIPGGPIGEMACFGPDFRKKMAKELGCRFLYCRFGSLQEKTEADVQTLRRNQWKPARYNMSSGLTMHYSLAGDEDDRFQRASGNWRHNLKRSARHELSISHWPEPEVSQIIALYREMELLKSLPPQFPDQEIANMVRMLGPRLVLYRCLDKKGKLLAIRAAGILGDQAMDLMAAAGVEARKLYATHATLWALLDHCQRDGMVNYDLSGVDPVQNKGVYDFKHGTGARLVENLAEWDWASLPGLRLLINLAIWHRGM